jgi:hypothetical protein
MFARLGRLATLVAAALVVASCGQVGVPTLPPGVTGGGGVGFSALPFGCYVAKQAPAPVEATITFYGWPDNSPPGNSIAHPVIHQVASGDGTYCNPTTFATERKNNREIPYGMKIYVPFMKQYFVREDDCAPSGPPIGHGSNGCFKLWFDLWLGGDGRSNPHAVVHCENALTPNAKVRVILNPDSGMPVKLPGPIYRDDPPPAGTCFGKPGHIHGIDNGGLIDL